MDVQGSSCCVIESFRGVGKGRAALQGSWVANYMSGYVVSMSVPTVLYSYRRLISHFLICPLSESHSLQKFEKNPVLLNETLRCIENRVAGGDI